VRRRTLLPLILFLLTGLFLALPTAYAASSLKPTKTLREIVKKGLAMFKSGEMLKSEYYFREALKAYPENPQVQNNLGVVLKTSGYVAEAEVRFKKAVSMAPWNQEAYFNLASLYLFLNYPKKAVEVHNKSLQWGGSFLDWGFFFYDNQTFMDAKRAFYAYIHMNPHDFLGHYGAGITLYSLRRLAPALHELLEAEKHSPNNPAVLNAIGVVMVERRRFKEAEEKFKKAALQPDFFIASYVNLAKLYKNWNRAPESRKIIAELMASRKTKKHEKGRFSPGFSAELESVRGEFLYLEGKKQEAKVHFIKARKQDKNNKHFFLYNIGFELENRGEFEKAIEKYGEALKVDANAYDVWFRLGLCYFYTDKFTEALDAYSNARKYRKDFLLDYYIGICYKDMHKWKEAVLYLNASIAKKNNAKAHLALALIYKRLAKTKRALAYFNNLLIMEPQNSYAKKQIVLLGGSNEQKHIKTFGQLLGGGKVMNGVLFEDTKKLEMLSKGKNGVLHKNTYHAINKALSGKKPDSQKVADGAGSSAHGGIDSGFYYTLQLLSSKNREEAEKFLLKLKAKGYDAVLIKKEVAGKGTWYRIRFGQFSSMNEAENEGEKLKELENIKYWISNITDKNDEVEEK